MCGDEDEDEDEDESVGESGPAACSESEACSRLDTSALLLSDSCCSRDNDSLTTNLEEALWRIWEVL